DVDAIGGERRQRMRARLEGPTPHEMAVGGAQREDLSGLGRQHQPAVVPDRTDRELLGEGQLPCDRAVGRLERAQLLRVDEKQQAVADRGFHLRAQGREPLLGARHDLVGHDAIAFDREEDRGLVVRGRRRELVHQRERPGRRSRKQRRQRAIDLRPGGQRMRSRAGGLRAKDHPTGSDQGKRTTTSSGQPRYNSVILLVPVIHQTIIVLDFGSQFTQLIARRLRELGVYSEVWPPDAPMDRILARDPVGIILSGGPKSVSDATAPKCDPAVYAIGRPVLGICYGMQLMADQLGGRVAPAASREFGHATVAISEPAALFANVPAELQVWASHGDFVAAAPAGFSVVATSTNAPIAAMSDAQRSLYAILFHPEVVHTESGLEILRNFAFGICGCSGDWTMASFVEEATARVRARVGEGRVVCALSGGVDSTVAALIIHRAVG